MTKPREAVSAESLGMKVKRDVPLKIKPSDLRRQAAAMIREGSMPSLDTVLQAVADVRKKYGGEIKAGRNRRGKHEQLLANVTKSQIVKF